MRERAPMVATKKGPPKLLTHSPSNSSPPLPIPRRPPLQTLPPPLLPSLSNSDNYRLPSTCTDWSFDIETYGSCKRNRFRTLLPDQTVFHPQRSRLTDGCPPHSIILSASLTERLVHSYNSGEHPDSHISNDGVVGERTHRSICTSLSQSKPGRTFLFDFARTDHQNILLHTLNHATSLCGMNLLFDLLYISYAFFSRLLWSHMSTPPLLIDMGILNFLECPLRTARSQKTLGPVLRQYRYDKTLKDRKFEDPYTKTEEGDTLFTYNGEDTHNAILGISELSRRLLKKDSPASSDYTIHFYSSVLWSCLHILKAGIPHSVEYLQTLEKKLLDEVHLTSLEAQERFSIILTGKGSQKSKDSFISSMAARIGEPVLSHPMLVVTEKKKKISWSDSNRLLFTALTTSDEDKKALSVIDKNATASKLLSSYVQPLLHHRANDPSDRSSILLGHGPIQLAYPTIYVVPSAFSDTSSDEGGQQQCRISFKKPAAQTYPKAIKKAYSSRYGALGKIVSYDLAQAELRVAAVLSGEPSLLEAFSKNIDLHAVRAVDTLRIPLDSLPSDWDIDGTDGNKLFKKAHDTPRQCAKHANFTDLNWGSWETLRLTILKKSSTLVDPSICKAMVDARPILRPILWRWQNEWLESARSTHRCILPITGQSRLFPGEIKGNDVNECINFPIQAFAALTMLRIQSLILPLLPSSCKMFLNCYDALYFDTLTTEIPKLDSAFKEAHFLVTTSDFWHFFCSHYGHPVSLSYERTIH